MAGVDLTAGIGRDADRHPLLAHLGELLQRRHPCQGMPTSPKVRTLRTVTDQLERTTNLLALLLETRTPLTLDEIVNQLGDMYPPNAAARRGAFERDKGLLRDIGVPIETQVLAGERAGQTAYWVNRERYELRGLDLTDAERQALQVAVAMVRSTEGEFGLLK